jgi:filamentous hemagglutinin family protein
MAAPVLPTGGVVTAGSATITVAPATVTVNQTSSKGIITWSGFSIGQDATVQINNGAGATLNRVTGTGVSSIDGLLSATGSVYLINSNGVIIGKTGVVKTGGTFAATTLDVSDQTFLAGGALSFSGASMASVINLGQVGALGGNVALIAAKVENGGTITAPNGSVGLVAGYSVTLKDADNDGGGLFSVQLGGSDTSVINSGAVTAASVELRAQQGNIYALAADTSSIIRATGVTTSQGRVWLTSEGGAVTQSGAITAVASLGAGGTVQITGQSVDIAGAIDVSGAQGGRIEIGGGPAGGGPLAHASTTTVEASASLTANATTAGSGGQVVLWSDDLTTFSGKILALGGSKGGNGGQVEVSSAGVIALGGSVDGSAPEGALGTILLDPHDLTISSTSPTTTPSPTSPNIAYNTGGTTTDSVVSPTSLMSLTGDLVLQASRNLIVASNLNYTQGSVTLEAGANLTINSGVTLSSGGNLLLSAGASDIPGFSSTGALSVQGTITGQAILLSAGTGGIALNGTLAASNELKVDTLGAVTQSAGSVQTPILFGDAASISLPSTTNQIAGLNNFSTSAGGVTLVTASGLTVGSASGGVITPAGQTISLQADTLSLTAASGQSALSAPGGTVIFQPLTAGRGITLTTAATLPGGVLALTPAELTLVNTDTLQLGGTAATTGNIVIGQSNETIDLVANGDFGVISLRAGGAISQGGPLLANALNGSGTSITLANAGNSILSLANLLASVTLAVADNSALAVTGTVRAGTELTLTDAGAITENAGGQLTAPTISLTAGAGGALTLAGGLTASTSATLAAGVGGIGLAGAVSTGPLAIDTSGALVQTAGSVTASDIRGQASSVLLSSATNAIAGVASQTAGFTVTGASGDFTLVDSSPLTVGSTSLAGGLSVQAGRTISLTTDSLTLQPAAGGLATLSAPSGTILLAPYTSGSGVLLTSGSKPAGVLALTTSELAVTSASTLQLGKLNVSGTPTAGNITLGQAGETIDLGASGYSNLILLASGAVTQGGPLGVVTVSGQAGSLALGYDVSGVGSNFIQNLAGFTTTSGDISLVTSSGLTVSGTVIANGGAGAVTLAATGSTGQTNADGLNVGMLLTGAVTGATVSLSTSNGATLSTSSGISQTGGALSATTLTGTGGFATFTQANTVANLGAFTTYDALTVMDSSPLIISGAVTSQAGALTLNAAGITQSAPISAVEFDGASSADTLLSSSANTIQAIGGFTQSAGDFTLATSSPVLTFGGNTGLVSATSGSLTFIANVVRLALNPIGGLSAPQGVITFAPLPASSGRRIELIGTTTADPNSLSLSQAFLNRITAAQVLALGDAAASGPINIANAGETITIPLNAALQLQTTGAVTEGISPAGQNGGGSLGLVAANVAGTTGSLALAAAVNQIGAIGGGSTASGSLSGLLSSGSITIATSTALVLENAVSVNATSGLLALTAGGAITQSSGAVTAYGLTGSAAGATLTAAGNSLVGLSSFVSSADFSLTDSRSLLLLGAVSVGSGRTLTITDDAPGLASGGSLAAPGGTVALRQYTAGVGFTLGGGNGLSGAAPITAQTLSVGSPTGGPITIAGAFNLSSIPVLNLESAGAIIETGAGALHLATLTGSSASLALGGANQIATLGAFTTTGAFTLQTFGSALTVAGAVNAGGALTLVDSTAGVSLAAGGGLASGGAILIAADGTFTNAAGANALSPGMGSSFTIYTRDAGDPADVLPNDSFGGLAAKNYYNDAYDFSTGSFASAAPSGDHFVYSYAAKLTYVAAASDKVYGAVVPTLSGSLTGLLNGDTTSGTLTFSTTATAGSHVASGPFAITGSGLTTANNYVFVQAAGNAAALTITPASLTITANDQTKVYGAAVPTLTDSYSGLVNGDTSGSLTTAATNTTTATAASHVAGGPYAITASGAVDSDYAISYVAGALTVTPTSLTITANDQTKVYGAAVPTLTDTYFGLVNGDTSASLTTAATNTTMATAASHVAGGPYAITASGAVDSDYAISYVAGAQ